MSTPDYDPKDLRALLPLYVGGDLDPEETERVRVQLPNHPELVAELAAFQEAREALLTAGTSQPAALDLWPGIRSAMLSEGLLGSSDSRAERRGPVEAAPAPIPTVASSSVRPFSWGGLRLVSGLAAAAFLEYLALQSGAAGDADPARAFQGGVAMEDTASSAQDALGGSLLADSTPIAAPESVSSELASSDLLAAQPEAGASPGLRPVFEGDDSMEDLQIQTHVPSTWVAPVMRSNPNNLAGYR